MSRVAVFVDAGYLFAQGAKAVTGVNQPRSNLRLDETAVLSELRSVASIQAPKRELLRVYWYDGVNNFKGPTLDHQKLANSDNVKLRLGFINASGQQKGVDSLIVTDLIDLARNHAISDAVLLSGDEDIRIGVQIAQQFGVRVHLVGIVPSVGSQSKYLCQEADTKIEWDASVVGKFLAMIDKPIVNDMQTSPAPVPQLSKEPNSIGLTLDVQKAIEEFAAGLDQIQRNQLNTHWSQSGGVPPEFDGRILARCRAILGRDLDTTERKLVRAHFRQAVQGNS